MKRKCMDCNSIIEECMGSVVAGDFLDFIDGKNEQPRELCGKCTLLRIEGKNSPDYLALQN